MLHRYRDNLKRWNLLTLLRNPMTWADFNYLLKFLVISYKKWWGFPNSISVIRHANKHRGWGNMLCGIIRFFPHTICSAKLILCHFPFHFFFLFLFYCSVKQYKSYTWENLMQEKAVHDVKKLRQSTGFKAKDLSSGSQLLSNNLKKVCTNTSVWQ